MTTQKEVSIAFSGSIPINYDAYLGPLFFEPFAKDLIGRIRSLQPQSVLEVACGTGRVTKYLPEVLPDTTSILATDINPAMIDYAKGVSGPGLRLQWGVVDAVNLPYRAEQFDCIISQFGVMFYSDRPRAYAEALRTLKPGGVFIFSAWDKVEHNPAAQLTDQTLSHFFPINAPAFYKVPFSYWDEQTIRRDLESAGFETVEMEVLQLTGHADTAESAAKGLLEGTPVYTAIVDRDKALLAPLRKQLAEELAYLFGPRHLKVPLQARIVTAVKRG